MFGKLGSKDFQDNMALTVFLMYEWQKGTASFWAPYIDYMPDYSFFCTWDDDITTMTQDMSLQVNAQIYKMGNMKVWRDLEDILSKYP
jgi:hypothetical protein